MPVPKRRTSKTKKNKRRSHDALTPPQVTACPKCGEAIFPHRACPSCGVGLPELTPQLFSFNSPLGMCIDCNGLGSSLEVDPDLIVPNPEVSIADGAIEPWSQRFATLSLEVRK